MKSMLAITHRRILDGSSLIILLFLTACSSEENTRDDMSPPSRAEQASRINTELGAGYMRRGNYQLAQQKLQKAVAFDPGNAQALSTLAILHEQINEPDEARRYHRQAVKADPEDASVQNNYGAFLCKIGDYRQSEKHFLNAANNAFYQTPELALVNAAAVSHRLKNIPGQNNICAERYRSPRKKMRHCCCWLRSNINNRNS